MYAAGYCRGRRGGDRGPGRPRQESAQSQSPSQELRMALSAGIQSVAGRGMVLAHDSWHIQYISAAQAGQTCRALVECILTLVCGHNLYE